MNIIKVLLVEDHAVVRAGLRALMQAFPAIQIVGEAENGHEGVRAAEKAEKHRYGLMMELDIHNIATLTRYAAFSGVIESNRLPSWPARPLSAPAREGAKIALTM